MNVEVTGYNVERGCFSNKGKEILHSFVLHFSETPDIKGFVPIFSSELSEPSNDYEILYSRLKDELIILLHRNSPADWDTFYNEELPLLHPLDEYFDMEKIMNEIIDWINSYTQLSAIAEGLKSNKGELK